MTIKVDLTEEAIDELFLDEMEVQISDMKNDLQTMEETSEGTGYKSWDYAEDKAAVTELLKSFEQVFDYYGGNL